MNLMGMRQKRRRISAKHKRLELSRTETLTSDPRELKHSGTSREIWNHPGFIQRETKILLVPLLKLESGQAWKNNFLELDGKRKRGKRKKKKY